MRLYSVWGICEEAVNSEQISRGANYCGDCHAGAPDRRALGAKASLGCDVRDYRSNEIDALDCGCHAVYGGALVFDSRHAQNFRACADER